MPDEIHATDEIRQLHYETRELLGKIRSTIDGHGYAGARQACLAWFDEYEREVEKMLSLMRRCEGDHWIRDFDAEDLTDSGVVTGGGIVIDKVFYSRKLVEQVERAASVPFESLSAIYREQWVEFILRENARHEREIRHAVLDVIDRQSDVEDATAIVERLITHCPSVADDLTRDEMFAELKAVRESRRKRTRIVDLYEQISERVVDEEKQRRIGEARMRIATIIAIWGDEVEPSELETRDAEWSKVSLEERHMLIERARSMMRHTAEQISTTPMVPWFDSPPDTASENEKNAFHHYVKCRVAAQGRGRELSLAEMFTLIEDMDDDPDENLKCFTGRVINREAEVLDQFSIEEIEHAVRAHRMARDAKVRLKSRSAEREADVGQLIDGLSEALEQHE